MLPTDYQFERAKFLCRCLAESGHAVSFKTMGNFSEQLPMITVIANRKVYKFADPNWDTVNKQLQQMVNAFAIS
jgi:hypothetical protein